MTGPAGRSEVIVVGAGVVGLAVAFELVGRGVQVVVVEPGGLGDATNASLRAAGVVGPQAETEALPEAAADLALLSRHLYADWVDRVESESGLACELDARGGMTVALSDLEEVALDRALDWQRARGLPFEVLSAEEAVLREPALSADAASAFAFPLESQVGPVRLLAALAVAVRAAGVRIIEGAPVLGLLEEGGRVIGVETAAGRFRAPTVIQTAGRRLPGAAGALATRLSAFAAPVVELDASEDPERLRRFVATVSLLVVPRRDGSLHAQGPWEPMGHRPRPAASAVGSLLDRAVRLVPAAAGYAVRGVGTTVRWDAPDGVPCLGETPLPGLLVSEGGDEVATAPARAAFLADLATGRMPPLPPGPFSPARSFE